jgi:hypothetical protein
MKRSNRTFMRRCAGIVAVLSLAVVSATLATRGSALAARQAEPRWWKGNTHTHTLWSDGDGAPELVVD